MESASVEYRANNCEFGMVFITVNLLTRGKDYYTHIGMVQNADGKRAYIVFTLIK